MIIGAALLLQSCVSVGPDYEVPDLSAPDMWQAQLVQGVSTGETPLETWWRVFNDPVLDGIMDRAVDGNLDLRAAYARIKEARAIRGVATGERYPDINGGGDVSRQRQTEDFGPLNPTNGRQTDWVYSTGVDGSWEIDFWGRISRRIASADADFQASIEDYRDILVLLYSEIARNYVDVRTFQERIEVAQRNVKTQRDSLEITQARFRAEISPELDVRQAELNLARTESLIPELRQAAARAVHRLGVLIGANPGVLYTELSTPTPIPQPPPEVLVSVPANLVRQRPDIRSAERRLAAQSERIGIATADLYPSFFLLGDFGYLASSDLFDSRNRVWSFGPTFRWNLFDGGRVRNRIEVQNARTEAALASYEQTVLSALEEVENALVGYTEETIRRESLLRSVEAARKSVELVGVLYKSGLTDFQNVLDMERSLAEQEDTYVASVGPVTQCRDIGVKP
jgi:NodT family efflux transporter outer membrane factor (OMF) lipoprotein